MSKLIIKERYGTTPNEVLNHSEISLKAKGLYGFLQCKPESWNFSTERIAQQLKESIKTIRNTLQELESFGLLERELRAKDDKGKWTGYNYILNEKVKTIGNKPSYPKRVVPKKDSTDNGEDISKKDYSNKDIVRKKYINIADKSANENLSESKPNIKITDLYEKMGLKKPIKSVNRWQDEANNATEYFLDGEDKRSSIFKCFKDDNQKARTALNDCKELSKKSVMYFLKVYNELKK